MIQFIDWLIDWLIGSLRKETFLPGCSDKRSSGLDYMPSLITMALEAQKTFAFTYATLEESESGFRNKRARQVFDGDADTHMVIWFILVAPHTYSEKSPHFKLYSR